MSELVECVDEVAGVYFRSLLLPQAGTKVAQHVHPYAHATYCGSGSAGAYIDGILTRILRAGEAMEIVANRQHEFVSLEDNTRLLCVHGVDSAEYIKERGL